MLKIISKIIGYTIRDFLHQRSFYVFTAVSVLFVLLLRGCFKGDVMVNGQQLDTVTVGWHMAVIAFHLISVAGMFIGVLLGMRAVRSDRDNGTLVFIMSKPVSRLQYIIGKTIGIWILSFVFMFLLHLTVYLIMLFYTGGRIPWYLAASVISSLNVFFAVAVVVTLSLFLPDTIAAFLTVIIGIVSFVSDSVYAAMKTAMARSIMENTGLPQHPVALWRIVWPKIGMLQQYASSLIRESEFSGMGPVHPSINIVLYTALIVLLLLWRFSKEEIG
jgi:ABC-type transport system involved in multi-copper enzyme maturation permease subunit